MLERIRLWFRIPEPPSGLAFSHGGTARGPSRDRRLPGKDRLRERRS